MDEITKKNHEELSRRLFLKKLGLFTVTTASLGTILDYNINWAWAGELDRYVPMEPNNPSLVWDRNKCKQCGKCVKVCKDTQSVYGYYSRTNNQIACVQCGQCLMKCPQGAIKEVDDTAKVWNALGNSKKHVVVQTSPASRVSLGEEFGLATGTIVVGKQVAGLKALGFDAVFDTTFAADLTIMEEATELINRLTGQLNKPVPQITSCCPGWIKFCEYFYPDLLPNLSTAKSPQQMMGAMVKSYYSEKKGLNPADVVSVSIMPCTAKKFELTRPEMNDGGKTVGRTDLKDMDTVLTTRELARMLKQKGINFPNLSDASYDSLLGEGTGAGTIFGASGGVMEAALRTAYYLVTNQHAPEQFLNLTELRGLSGIKEDTVNIPGYGNVNVVVCQGLKNARRILDEIRSGSKQYHFIEIMACPGGCVGGGGQPKTSDGARQTRQQSLYTIDKTITQKRLSYQNQEVQALYQTYLGQPNGEKAHQLLHTDYAERKLLK